ncbi:MerR family transcriptional regulator [Anaerocolumna sedimenticola]|uniref:MerR family transcriptional regulator n=1 Tax=Anaerocolumna sedimenticola TaxID=2696063 RepID=A0A6P1TN45_9FIRM|nr:MerR family transcriptional regulator [Anaerocolumna sedimenticola]QHQ61609.1 MerR family transcriptional regulator [Anaerocolumna sedimenticola]
MGHTDNKYDTYTIGQVSAITGISRDRLRYYEEKGLLLPDQNNDNNYRNYTICDIDKVLSIEFYLSMNLSMKEIGSIWAGDSYEEISSVLGEREKEITKKIDELQNYLVNIRKGKEACDRIAKNLNQFSIQVMPAFEVLGEMSDYRAYKEYENIHRNKNELRGKPIIHSIKRMLTYSEKGIESNKMLITRNVSKSTSENNKIISFDKCLYTIVEDSINKGDIMQDMFHKCYSYANENQLSGKGFVIISMLLITVNHGNAKSYLEVFAPIE